MSRAARRSVRPGALAKDKSEKTPKSSKKEKKEAVVEEVETPGNESSAFKRAHVCAIANPLASEKLTKKVLKLVKKAAKRKQIKRGVKEVIKSIRKGGKGVVLIAGDISPIDVITPLPVLCEDAGLPYVYVPSKEELGQAGLTKRPTSCMLVLSKPGKGAAKSTAEEDKEFEGVYSEVSDAVKAVQPVF
ncbi:hypothetical protein H632_c774p0 [Helicosporidium sp. ATCC 50920]|nr:hypothetical protein H632_c774p0 [Helicosporidium sp. ATCC 50920]|eukprot:KDD75272.1 hypothetical protein H632_c774p0 [Helicosporidium sp. ATCC 50920]